MTTTSPDANSRRPASPWRLILALATVLLLVVFLRFRAQETGQLDSGDLPLGTGAPVVLEQRRPEKEPHQVELRHFPGMTVRTATLRAGAEQASWASDWRGEGEMALLEALGGVANQGGDGLNWQFEVNGVYADRGAGDFELAPGDRVLWKLAPYE